MTLSRKHYIKIAEILNRQKSIYSLSDCKEQIEINKTISRITSELNHFFKEDNPLFNEIKFKDAVNKA